MLIKFIFIYIFSFPVLFFSQGENKRLIDFVNLFIGTQNSGNTFPGAVVPWGMVSMSPHNAPNSPSGYIKGEKYFFGFGSVHLSGTGCPDLGSVIFSVSKGSAPLNPENYKTFYENEEAVPGYYSLYLPEFKVKAEVTSSMHCGIIKYTSQDSTSLDVLIDAGRNLSILGGGFIKIVSDHEVEGYNISGGFCGEDNREKIYFYAQFSSTAENFRIWVGNSFIHDSSRSVADTSIGYLADCRISKDNPLIIKIGISYVSVKNAKENLEEEIPLWDFNEIKNKSGELWENNLSRINVEGKDEDKIKFYTALYHMLIHPNVISDVNGDYPLMGRNGIGNYKDRKRYSVFSLWDTYRTLHPFLSLVYPEKQSEILKTMVDMYSENGYLPKWELAGNETYMMVGDPAALVVADSYNKGIRDFNIDLAFEALLKPAILNSGQEAPPIRAGYHQLLKYGYIPFEQDTIENWWVWGPASTTLEYCYSDWAISQLAESLGKANYFNLFKKRSLNYRNLFDESTKFIRPKLKNGSWLTPFDPLATEGSGNWGGSGGPGYVEGNAWNYTWFVPYDINGLIKLFSGKKYFSNKLLKAFSADHFTIDNEPDIAYPYLFTYLKDQEHITRELVSKIIENDFGTDADGLPGNDDCGTISAWLVFSSLGFYPACVASNEYRIGIPLFDKITIKLNKKYYAGKDITIIKRNKDFSTVTFNNKNISYSLEHNELIKGGELIFK